MAQNRKASETSCPGWDSCYCSKIGRHLHVGPTGPSKTLSVLIQRPHVGGEGDLVRARDRAAAHIRGEFGAEKDESRWLAELEHKGEHLSTDTRCFCGPAGGCTSVYGRSTPCAWSSWGSPSLSSALGKFLAISSHTSLSRALTGSSSAKQGGLPAPP